MKTRINFYSPYWLLCLGVLLMSVLLTGCVTPIPFEKEAPELTYKATDSILVSVIDERDALRQGKPATYIGRAHGVFGIPSDMETYPWFVSDKSKKGQSLAQALEERIVVGLGNQGWQLASAGITRRPTEDEVVALLTSHGAQHLLLISITQWFTSINLNWVTAFNFDWGYILDILDANGIAVESVTDFGTDVVDEEAKQSPQNMIKMAFKERLIKILERPELKAALNSRQTSQNVSSATISSQPPSAPQDNHQYAVAERSVPQSPVSPAYIEELEALQALRDDGIFTEEEFQKQKKIILERESR